MSERENLYQRKRRAMELMAAGLSWQEANTRSGLEYSRRGIQQLYSEWRTRGAAALQDHRGGSRYRKATVAIHEQIIARCGEDAELRSPKLTAEIAAEFGVELHAGYLSVLRRQLGLPVARPGRPRRQAALPTPPAAGAEDFSPCG